jgi:hypothetical protein
MNDSMTSKYIEFREPRTIQELEAMLRLRYMVRRSSNLAVLCPENEAGIDLDHYDRHAYHVGLFTPSDDGFVPIGCSRVVIGQLGPMNRWISEIGQKNRLDHKLADPATPFPSLNHMPVEYRWKVMSLYTTVCNINEEMGESSGTVLDPEIRSLRVARSWVEAIVAYFRIWKGIGHGVMSIAPHHMTFYERFGFYRFPGLPSSWITATGLLCTFCLIDTLSISPDLLARLSELSDELSASGKIVISNGAVVSRPAVPTFIPDRTAPCLLG